MREVSQKEKNKQKNDTDDLICKIEIGRCKEQMHGFVIYTIDTLYKIGN